MSKTVVYLSHEGTVGGRTGLLHTFLCPPAVKAAALSPEWWQRTAAPEGVITQISCDGSKANNDKNRQWLVSKLKDELLVETTEEAWR